MKTGRVYTDYDPIRILWPVKGDVATDEMAAKAGLVGNWHEVTESDIPATREDRNEWEYKNGKVKPDPVKVKAKKDKEKEKQDVKDSAKSKLQGIGLTADEIEDIIK